MKVISNACSSQPSMRFNEAHPTEKRALRRPFLGFADWEFTLPNCPQERRFSLRSPFGPPCGRSLAALGGGAIVRRMESRRERHSYGMVLLWPILQNR